MIQEEGAAAPVLEDTILLLGGYVYDGTAALIDAMTRAVGLVDLTGTLTESDIVELYNPQGRSVVRGTPLPEPTADHIPVVVDNQVLVAGGTSNQTATEKNWQVDVQISWRQVRPVHEPIIFGRWPPFLCPLISETHCEPTIWLV